MIYIHPIQSPSHSIRYSRHKVANAHSICLLHFELLSTYYIQHRSFIYIDKLSHPSSYHDHQTLTLPSCPPARSTIRTTTNLQSTQKIRETYIPIMEHGPCTHVYRCIHNQISFILHTYIPVAPAQDQAFKRDPTIYHTDTTPRHITPPHQGLPSSRSPSSRGAKRRKANRTSI